MSFRYARNEVNANNDGDGDDDEEEEDEDEGDADADRLVDVRRQLERHPYKPECEAKTIYASYRHHGQSPLDVRLSDAIKLRICACRSVSHVWGKFASESARAVRHNPDGSVVAVDLDLRSYNRIHHRDLVGAAFDPRRPLWVFVVDDRRPARTAPYRRRYASRHHHHHHHHNTRSRRHRRHRHRSNHRYQAPPEPPVISCCNVM